MVSHQRDLLLKTILNRYLLDCCKCISHDGNKHVHEYNAADEGLHEENSPNEPLFILILFFAIIVIIEFSKRDKVGIEE